jgi:hypothetical protein
MTKKLLFLLAFLPWAAIAQNNYLDFDGTNDVVETSTATATMLGNATALTMSCKVYPTRVTSGFPDFNGICGYRNEINFDFYLIQLSSTDLEARFRNSAGVGYTITYTGLTLNQWNHFFLVYNGSTLKLYKNGAEVSSIAASGTVPAAPPGYLSIGRLIFQTYNWFHKGYIDEVSVWNKALTQTDIDAIMANSGEIVNPGGQSNLKAYYKFNQGIPYGNNAGLTTLNDELGLNNGILANFALTGNSSNWGGTELGIGHADLLSVNIFPNPAKDFIRVSGLTEATDFQIHDATGRLIKSQTIQPDEQITISGLQAGLYFLSSNDWQKKFIVK